jgi:hypothetical protein
MPKLTTPCWIWPLAPHRLDGRATVKSRYIYRLVYEAAHNVVLDPDEILHHKCETPACINPAHMRLVTRSEHAIEHGKGGDWGQGDKTHCRNGHPYDDENTELVHRSYNGYEYVERRCRICTRETKRRYRERQRDEHSGDRV